MNSLVPAVKIEGIIPIEGQIASESDRKSQVLNTARQVFGLSGRAKLALAGCLQEIREKGYWDGLAESFDKFVYIEFGYKPSTADALIRVYETFVNHLKIDPETVAHIPWARLAMIVPQITEDNQKHLIELAENCETQSELSKELKNMKGLHVTESKGKEGTKFTFTTNDDQAEVVKAALALAEELHGEDCAPGLIYETIFADFLLNNQDGGDHLDKSIELLENMYGIKIQYTREEDEIEIICGELEG